MTDFRFTMMYFHFSTGAGGGWAPGNYTGDKKTTGSALLGTDDIDNDGGGVGGGACYKSRGNTKGYGGFGGGGGGCVAGGGGGGFTGKEISFILKTIASFGHFISMR